MHSMIDVREISVGMGECAASAGYGDRLMMTLGSCVGVILVDHRAKVVAALHAMLPEGPADTPQPTRYVATGVPLLIQAAIDAGADRKRLVAKLVGGANMFPKLMRRFLAHVGQRNADAARAALLLSGIKIEAEDIGGNSGRSVAVDVSTGEVSVRVGETQRRI